MRETVFPPVGRDAHLCAVGRDRSNPHIGWCFWGVDRPNPQMIYIYIFILLGEGGGGMPNPQMGGVPPAHVARPEYTGRHGGLP